MIPDDVRRRVAAIREIAGDDEAAHSAEDRLWSDVLESIAHGDCDDPQACAELALKTKALDFQRWCA
jgi:hypothetical protein